MAKDVCSKPASNSNSENNSSPNSDQQKVPPLRIVLHTSGNQKSSISAVTSSATATTSNLNQPNNNPDTQDLKRERGQNARTDHVVKTSGRVRIKLGTSKQVHKGNSNQSGLLSGDRPEDTNKSKIPNADKQSQINDSNKEDSNINYSHLRRITRRSQRSIQTINNEDEESVSSMTSVDENQLSSSNNCSDNNNGGQEAASAASNQTQNVPNSCTSISNQNTNGACTNPGVDTPRRYKRRRGEPSESQLTSELDIFGWQNYKLPVQNSFELFRSIRLQVDKRIGSLNIAHPKFPYGFKDYMITRGAYLLDGNKLGNGTHLLMNEDGGLNTAPASKLLALRYKTNYSVPNKARVPLGLPVNSPLYNLFIEQEKDRHRMRMQHLKEREKLTLAAEQEIVRVYNQAAMAASNQPEPFSACLMLKHQEIYNYLDSDGSTLQIPEDESTDQAKQDGVRTRRRQHEQTSSSPAQNRKQLATEDQSHDVDSSSRREKTKCSRRDQNDEELNPKNTADDPSPSNIDTAPQNKLDDGVSSDLVAKPSESQVEGSDQKNDSDKIDKTIEKGDEEMDSEKSREPSETKSSVEPPSDTSETKDSTEKNESNKEGSQNITKAESTKKDTEQSEEISDKDCENPQEQDGNPTKKQKLDTGEPDVKPVIETPKEPVEGTDTTEKQDIETQDVKQTMDSSKSEPVLSDDDRRAYNKEVFLSQLREIDDKWDRIRGEMLIRHRNEAESLYAVQKLEWEWKIKEIGACDVRTTPVIEDALVPRLIIYSQDY